MVIALKGPGVPLAEMLAERLPADLAVICHGKPPGFQEVIADAFQNYRALVMVMATGIAVRTAGPLLKSKHSDPAIVVVDRAGRYAVSLAGGHEGGANQLACDVASLCGGGPVITTGTEAGKHVSVGVGYRRNATAESINFAIMSGLEQCGLDVEKVRFLATGLIKWRDPEIKKAASDLGLLLRHFSNGQLSHIEGVSGPSQASMRHFSIKGVSEQCALLCLKNPEIILPRIIIGPVTVSIAREKSQLWV